MRGPMRPWGRCACAVFRVGVGSDTAGRPPRVRGPTGHHGAAACAWSAACVGAVGLGLREVSARALSADQAGGAAGSPN